MKGVILAGGRGTRLGELTRVVNKHLLPVGPWPMIYYPLHKLTGAGVTDILLISTPEGIGDFTYMLGSGKEHNCNITYRVQDEPGGIAQALLLAEEFCSYKPVIVLLGDNIYYDSLGTYLRIPFDNKAWLVLKDVSDAERYGVAVVDPQNTTVVDLEEKPAKPKSNLAVVGIYQYPPDVFEVIKTLEPSARGELEITDVNKHYMRENRLGYFMMNGYWVDTGTIESLHDATATVTRRPPRF